MKLRSIGVALGAASMLALGGCATYDYGYGYNQPYAAYQPSGAYAPGPGYAQQVEYGVVERIELYRGGSSSPINVGTILGGLAGGLLGHQIGSGSGNTAATIAGAVGGAVIGNQVQRNNEGDRYRVVVRLDSGDTIVVGNVDASELRVGDRVRVIDGRIYRS
jgi:outer membrane lipoprotein SlyB